MINDLLTRARAGDDEALTELLHLYDPRVRAGIEADIPARWRALVSADDIMQQTWLDAFLRVGTLAANNEAGLVAWLRQIAENNLRGAVRHLEADKRGGPAVAVELAGLGSHGSLFEAIFGRDSHTPSRIIREKEAEAALRAALEALPSDYRQAVQLHDLEGRPIAEIAALLNRSEGAVHMLRLRAHEQLRDMLARKSAVLNDFA